MAALVVFLILLEGVVTGSLKLGKTMYFWSEDPLLFVLAGFRAVILFSGLLVVGFKFAEYSSLFKKVIAHFQGRQVVESILPTEKRWGYALLVFFISLFALGEILGWLLLST